MEIKDKSEAMNFAIKTTYLGPTNHREERIKAKLLGDSRRCYQPSKTVGYDHGLKRGVPNHTKAVKALIQEMKGDGWVKGATSITITAGDSDHAGYIFFASPSYKKGVENRVKDSSQ